jgi:DNA polymerase-3 subunit alpha
MEAKANNIEVVKPTINESSSKYIVKEDKIIYPLSNIKGLGVVTCETIERAKAKGEFTDIYDCFSRLYIEGITKKVFEDLILADVFKEFKINRATLMYNLDSLYNYAELTKDIDPSLVMRPVIENQKDYTIEFLLEKEKELFGFFLSSHPITQYRKDNPYCITLNKVEDNFDKTVDVLILVEKIKIINTKKGDKMAFLTGSDETSTFEFTLFPKIFTLYQEIAKGDLLKIRGHVERRLDEYQIIVERIKKLKDDNNE